MRSTIRRIIAGIAVITGLAALTEAAVTTDETWTNGTFSVSSTDLLQTSLDNMDDSALTWATWGGDLTELNDGVFTLGAADYLFVTEGTLDFNLDLNASPDGYEINQIDTLTGNSNANRVMQEYTVSYATVAAPTTFIDIETVATDPNLNELKVSITENATGILATDVATIRYVFPPQQLGGVQYKEIDIIGTNLSVADTLPPLTNGAPQTVEELWAGYDPRAEPLDTEILYSWEEDGITLKVVRYRVGIFGGEKAMVAGVYGYPTGQTNLPALVNIHGGGQYADYRSCLSNAKRGYATLTVAWAGRIMRRITR
tara:strand:- start:541 stop:1482 length:942 start_codon:yes stop_codon:yes gene_type:complete